MRTSFAPSCTSTCCPGGQSSDGTEYSAYWQATWWSRLPQAPVVLAALALGLLARARQRHERRRLTGGLRSALDRFGTGMDPRHHLRIHLAWHEGESRWLIGHVGRHLTNTKT